MVKSRLFNQARVGACLATTRRPRLGILFQAFFLVAVGDYDLGLKTSKYQHIPDHGKQNKGVSLLTFMQLSPLITLALCAILPACTANTPFPPEVMEKVSPTFQFEAWRDAGPTNESGKSDAGIKAQLGGRIIQATEDGKGIVIVAAHLPIVNYPVYGPTDKEEVTRNGDHVFAFLFAGEIEPLDLMRGNRFIVVGTTTSRRPLLVNGIPKTVPFLIADCIHVWQTAGAEIAEFKEGVGGGFSPLPQTTYCVAKK